MQQAGGRERRSRRTPLWLAAAVVVHMGVGIAAAGGVSAQEPPPAAAPPGSELTAYLLTIGPGTRIWERFGHNALVIRDESTGSELAYDWGRFDFDQEDFLPRFLRGEMLYWAARDSASWLIYAYTRANRTVIAQELALTPAQRVELRRFLEWTVLEENRYYAYDYYLDNCSTRVRDALDRALGGALSEAVADVPTGATYRSHTQRLTADLLAVNTGLLLALGQPTDQALSAWEEGFIPMELAEHIRAVAVAGPDGQPIPLVRSERVLHRSSAAGPPDAPPSRIPGYLLAGLLGGGLLATLGWLGRRSEAARAGLGGGGLLWGLAYGIPGTLTVGLWLFTGHDFTYWNENVLQANPLGLFLAVLLPLALTRGRAAHVTVAVAVLAASLSLLGGLLQVLPGMDQRNGEIVALMLPLHLGLAAGTWWALLRPEPGPLTQTATAAGAERQREAA